MSEARFGFHASAWGGDHVLLALHETSRAGFQGIEVYGDISHVMAEKPEEFVVYAEIAGVRLAGLHSGGMLTAPDYHEAELLEWRRLLEWTQKAGGEYAIYYGGDRTAEHEADTEAAAALLNRIGAIAGDVGVRLLYEPDRQCPFDSLESISDLLGRTDPATVGISLDTARLTQMGADPTFFLLTQKARVGVVHLRDLRDPADPRQADDPYADPGRGTLDLKAVADTLRMTNFTGWVIGVTDAPQSSANESAQHTAGYFRDELDFSF